MSRKRLVAAVLTIAVLVLFARVPSVDAALPPPLRLALMFERPVWAEPQDRNPRPLGHLVVEWSRRGSTG